ncbi:hypothetical protein ACO1KW_14760, partial [Staphylococcus aureus]
MTGRAVASSGRGGGGGGGWGGCCEKYKLKQLKGIKKIKEEKINSNCVKKKIIKKNIKIINL